MHDLERCPTCQKLRATVYGAHIEGVLDDVPQSERCHCEVTALPVLDRPGGNPEQTAQSLPPSPRSPPSTRTTLPRKILVPTDFGDDAALALDYACELAAKVGARVHVVHFYSFPVEFTSVYGYGAPEVSQRIEMDSLRALATLLDVHGRPGVEASVTVRLGDARAGIQEVAEEVGADLICMGTHGRRGIKHLFMGSVAEHTVRVSRIPTLTVRSLPPA